MSRLITGDLSVFNVDGDLLANVGSVTLETDWATVERSPVNRLGEAETPVREMGRLDFDIASLHSTAPLRISNLDIGAFTLGGTSYLATLRGGSVSATHKVKSVPGVADRWDLPIVTKKRYEAEIEVALPDVASALFAEVPFDTIANQLKAFSITINGTAFTFPGLLKKFTHAFAYGEEQVYRALIVGESPDVGAYPTAPVGTANLLQTCLNDPRTPLAFAITSHATQGMDYDGNLIASSFGFTFNDAAIVQERYSMLTVGAPTGAKNYA